MHGEQCGIGTILMAYLHKINWKQIRTFLRDIRAPTTAEDLGIEGEFIIKALLRAGSIRPERYTILESKKLNYKNAKNIAEVTGVID
jgi:glycerol-1-phosphate dehydrogenase [NAD(P)+]